MKHKSARNRLAFAASLAAGLLIALAVGAFAAGRESTIPTGARTAEPVGVPAAKAMEVFNGTGQSSTAQISNAGTAALTALTTDRSGVSPDLLPGQADLTKAATLLSDVGQGGWSLVAAPTTKGKVCQEVISSTGADQGGTCTAYLTDTRPVSFMLMDVDYLNAGQPAFVTGVASDDVQSIAVMVGGMSYPAILQNNAFFYQLPNNQTSISGIETTLKNGSTVRTTVGALVPLPSQ